MNRRQAAPGTALLADVGGTHARFALLLPDGTISEPVDLPSANFNDLSSAAAESLSLLWKPLALFSSQSVREAAVAVAGPVTGDEVQLTNVGWSFSIEATRKTLGLERLVVINDVAALAWAVPALETAKKNEKAFIEGKDQDKEKDKYKEAFIEGKSETGGPNLSDGWDGADGERVVAVVAVGTGLGAATHVRSGGAEVVLASEGGHGDLAASSEREWRVVERLAARFGGHVSVERAVSGSGLANLWAALAELDGVGVTEPIEPEEVTRRAAAAEPRAREAVALFSGWLGAFAGNFALSVGARDGVWLGGGVLGALGAAFDRATFERRFVAKGRFESWLRGVPVRTIDDPLAAFRGLARRLRLA